MKFKTENEAKEYRKTLDKAHTRPIYHYNGFKAYYAGEVENYKEIIGYEVIELQER